MTDDLQLPTKKLSIKVQAVHPRVVGTDPIMHCYLCGNPLFDPIEWDHLIPRSWGGSSPVLIPVHAWCNGKRKDAPYFCSPDDQRKMISASTKAGLARARGRGKRLGAPPALTDDQVSHLLTLKTQGMKMEDIAELFGISKTTAYDYWKKAKAAIQSQR